MSSDLDHTSEEGWSTTVAVVSGADGFAFRPGELVVVGESGRDAAERSLEGLVAAAAEPVFPEESFGPARTNLFRLRGSFEVALAVDELRDSGFMAAPNHVVFAHGCGCPCGAHPADRWRGSVSGSPVYASPVYASPVYASPVYASPVYASPVYASPVYASPVYASPVYASSGRRRSSARPATPPALGPLSLQKGSIPRPARVAVLDTGMAAEGVRPLALKPFAPARVHWEVPDLDNDRYLDPAAGHGTFVTGLIALLAPGTEIVVERVLSNLGDGDEVSIARRVHELSGTVDIINLSFGGYSPQTMYALAAAVRTARAAGTVVVASAGNDATCRPTYPAALPGVVGVGALGPEGPAPFTNYGPWVRACAPGVDLVSWFFSEFDGPDRPNEAGANADLFQDWATWSGTSFAAPVVVAALARTMHACGVSAVEAVSRIVDAPGLFRLPDLGTVINLA